MIKTNTSTNAERGAVAWVVLWSLAAVCLGDAEGVQVQTVGNDSQVQIFFQNAWRQLIVTDNPRFEVNRVLCRSLGLPTGITAGKVQNYSRNAGSPAAVTIAENCLGTETNIGQCTNITLYSGVESTTLSLSCQEVQIALFNGTETSGLVMIKYDDAYRPLCADDFDTKWAKVVCRQLGLPSAHARNVNAYRFSSKRENGFRPRLVCTGNSTDSCEIQYDRGFCFHLFMEVLLGAVVCNGTAPQYQYQLRNLNGSVGRLEVKVDGSWGGVCKNASSDAFAEVACRSLKLPSTDARTHSGMYPRGSLPSAVGYSVCSGKEATLGDCYVDWQAPCNSNTYLGLSCSNAHEGQIRILDDGKVQIYHNNMWAGVSTFNSKSTRKVAKVICRSLNLTWYYAREIKASRSRREPAWRGIVSCSGNERQLSDCLYGDVSRQTTTVLERPLHISCPDTDPTVRLGSEGAVQLYLDDEHGIGWSIFTPDETSDFGDTEAALVCRWVGKPSSFAVAFQKYEADIPQLSYRYTLRGLRCSKTAGSWRDCSFLKLPEWDSKPVFVDCVDAKDRNSIQYRLRFSLRPSSSPMLPNVGIFEMSVGGVWGTVLHRDGYSDNVAKVMCRSLNMTTSGSRLVASKEFPIDMKSERVWIGSINCTGQEASPLDCAHSLSSAGVKDPKPVAVYCGLPYDEEDYSLRLVDGPDDYSGRLEVMMYGQWGTVCDRGFTDDDAAAACKTLGKSSSGYYTEKATPRTFPGGTGIIWMADMNCESSQDFQECKHTKVSYPTYCYHSQDVGVKCDTRRYTGNNPSEYGTNDDDDTGRIVGGTVGGCVLLAIIVAIVYLRLRHQGSAPGSAVSMKATPINDVAKPMDTLQAPPPYSANPNHCKC